MLRSVVEYPNISESGTSAGDHLGFASLGHAADLAPPAGEVADHVAEDTRTGVTTSTSMIGSRMIGWARLAASLKAIEPAILNAISD